MGPAADRERGGDEPGLGGVRPRRGDRADEAGRAGPCQRRLTHGREAGAAGGRPPGVPAALLAGAAAGRAAVGPRRRAGRQPHVRDPRRAGRRPGGAVPPPRTPTAGPQGPLPLPLAAAGTASEETGVITRFPYELAG
ncbi:MAG: hypothetical protein AVDCRST_MAG59-444 [uncultured Thermomicrobiales bacterium]|uniref:Uncharacterized protein n=1 Tax=uncultured Thermomicrobiales bacterium TaxID=1645740 RepID=A0A6J4U3F8_9BACT|nr:MAG: hypothetical protein AVDCRST_MAG59-444 [uncultured Thermomicrobiales bacterium]